MKNVAINSGTISGISQIETEHIKARGGIDIGKDATIGGSLTVSGSVMGSGAYTDISDVRFKRDVTTIAGADALRTVRALRGVTYVLDAEGFPDRGFDTSAQIGFIAQEVEAIMPLLVKTTPTATPVVNVTAAKAGNMSSAKVGKAGRAHDENEVKSVAYARAVPVRAEAIKEIDRRLEMRVAAAEQERQFSRGQNDCRGVFVRWQDRQEAEDYAALDALFIFSAVCCCRRADFPK